MKIILASQSPRRKELLEQLGVEFNIDVSYIEEKQQPNESAQEYVQRLSKEKAEAIVFKQSKDKNHFPFLVLGADTIVVLDGDILEKPENLDDSIEMLSRLSGRQHNVMTAVTAVTQNQIETRLVTTNVWFRDITRDEIVSYWATGEPQDKAGSYGIQGVGGRFVTRIEGSYHAVVGLPLFETDMLLKEFIDKN